MGPAAGDEGLAAGDEDLGIRVECLGLGGEEAVPEGQQRAASVMETAIGEPLILGYGALRRREIASREGQMPSVFEVGQGTGFVLELERPERVSSLRQPTLTTWIDLEDAPSTVPSPISSPMISLTVPSSVASPATAEAEGELPPTLFRRYDRDIGELFTRSGAVRDKIFSQRYRLRSLKYEREKITEERRARLDLDEIVASMRRGQEP
ncbi:hypothetical protein Tco_1290616 [Tanacetum coccineum]